MSEPAPTSAPSKKSSSGISWMGWNCPPRGQYFFFPSAPFFPLAQFLFGGTVFLLLFFLAHPWPQVLLWEAPTYANPPTVLLLTNPPASYWPHPPLFALTSITKASDLKRAWVAQSFMSTKFTGASRVGTFCPNKRSFNVVIVEAWKQEEFHCGGSRSVKARGASTRW